MARIFKPGARVKKAQVWFEGDRVPPSVLVKKSKSLLTDSLSALFEIDLDDEAYESLKREMFPLYQEILVKINRFADELPGRDAA